MLGAGDVLDVPGDGGNPPGNPSSADGDGATSVLLSPSQPVALRVHNQPHSLPRASSQALITPSKVGTQEPVLGSAIVPFPQDATHKFFEGSNITPVPQQDEPTQGGTEYGGALDGEGAFAATVIAIKETTKAFDFIETEDKSWCTCKTDNSFPSGARTKKIAKSRKN